MEDAERVLLGIIMRVKPGIKDIELNRESRLDSIGIDSMDLVEIVFSIEEKYDISIPFNANNREESAESFQTFGSVIDAVQALIVEQKVAKGAA